MKTSIFMVASILVLGGCAPAPDDTQGTTTFTASTSAPDAVSRFTADQVFSPEVSDMINEFDLATTRAGKLQVCADMSLAMEGMTDSEISVRLNAMDAYSASTLQDLSADCNRLIGLQ